MAGPGPVSVFPEQISQLRAGGFTVFLASQVRQEGELLAARRGWGSVRPVKAGSTEGNELHGWIGLRVGGTIGEYGQNQGASSRVMWPA